MIGLNKGIVIVLFIGWYFSHGKCDDFFMYHNEKINICNSHDSFIELISPNLYFFISIFNHS